MVYASKKVDFNELNQYVIWFILFAISSSTARATLKLIYLLHLFKKEDVQYILSKDFVRSNRVKVAQDHFFHVSNAFSHYFFLSNQWTSSNWWCNNEYHQWTRLLMTNCKYHIHLLGPSLLLQMIRKSENEQIDNIVVLKCETSLD